MAPTSLPARRRGCCQPIADLLPDATATQLATALKALADETRLQIVSTLKRTREPICICDLTASFDLSQPTISHHMAKLRDAGIVSCERRGIWSYYKLRDDAPAEARWLLDAIP